ncbi:MAG TPA: hypothetical protein VFG59_06185 [Anaeromyxobacter sp.]|nr:hypothetical protein [Anaeromyxobacter sp.]
MVTETSELGPSFVRRHHVHYDVRDELVVEGDERRKVGYRVRIWGVLPESGLLPGDAAESPFARELLALAEEVVPAEREGSTISVEPPVPALYESRVVVGADEIALDIRLVHGSFGDCASGAAEDRCLRLIRHALESLGAQQKD